MPGMPNREPRDPVRPCQTNAGISGIRDPDMCTRPSRPMVKNQMLNARTAGAPTTRADRTPTRSSTKQPTVTAATRPVPEHITAASSRTPPSSRLRNEKRRLTITSMATSPSSRPEVSTIGASHMNASEPAP